MKVLAKHRRASFDYNITERIVAGIALTGAETKSIKTGAASLKGSYVILRAGEAFLVGAHISPYVHAASDPSADPTRVRKLLLHRRQLDQLVAHKQAGLSVVPTALLLDRNFIKLEIGVGRGKKRYDKRAAIKLRDTNREIARALKR